ncbi:MBL fold metallo-hydrolase [Amycolatopsis magusensis]|uniref:MBL fold metallo-hydrolase n=1 Tax=Amycolatopsis magusensis TaxID=882444 RepID=UPI003792305F
MTHPAYGLLRQVSPTASVVLENNPSSMTLEGTNSWVLQAPGASSCVIVDPGYDDRAHLALLAACAPVSLILLTHHHPDHADGAPWLASEVSAPVRAFDPSLCAGGEALRPDEVISAAGLKIGVLHTPGHTADSVSLRVGGEVLTGDTILGRGTTVLDDLGAYLGSLRLLAELPPGTLGLPGHGPELPDLAATAREYLAHREQRLDQVRAALRSLGPDATPRQVVELVYADVDRALWLPAEHSVRAQLDYLRTL